MDLTSLLAGVDLARDLSNLGAFVSVTGYGDASAGGIGSTLAVNGPGGAASLTLANEHPIAVADLLNDGVLILPPH